MRFDDEVPTPALPPVDAAPAAGERRSDPGDAPEIAAEDMVAIESAPPARVALDLPPMRARLSSQPGVDLPQMRSRLPSQPLAPATAKPVAAPPPRAPLVIVPPHVGNLAPQAIESTGPRRKGRLWWEDLFNDDYVRTMEKLTDAQIAREVDFIEDEPRPRARRRDARPRRAGPGGRRSSWRAAATRSSGSTCRSRCWRARATRRRSSRRSSTSSRATCAR